MADDSVELPYLRNRLETAEAVCVLLGWCAIRASTDRDKALMQLWGRWVALVGEDFAGRAAHPELNDDVVKTLATEYDMTRAATLARGCTRVGES